MHKWIWFVVVLIVITACKKDEAPPPEDVSSHITSGNWRVTYYLHHSVDETSSFEPYVFFFSNSGVVTATSAADTISGTWSVRKDSGKTKFDLYFSSPSLFEEISEDWIVLESTVSKLRLQDQSGSSSDIDYLTFEKI